MAAPNYVPRQTDTAKYYESPPRRGDSWRAERPGDLADGQPKGAGLGRQGPDQGYALKLVRQFEDRVVLRDGERWEDASAGCVLVALKRASMFGRAPVIHDLEIAFRIFGYLDDPADDDLVALRADAFDRVDNPHHYLEARRIIDSVPEDTLRQNPKQVAAAHDRDWSALIDTDALVPAGHDHHDDD